MRDKSQESEGQGNAQNTQSSNDPPEDDNVVPDIDGTDGRRQPPPSSPPRNSDSPGDNRQYAYDNNQRERFFHRSSYSLYDDTLLRIRKYGMDIGGIPPDLDAGYKMGDLPVHHETQLQNKCIQSMADVCTALTHSIKALGGPVATNRRLEALMGQWICDMRATAQHYKYVSDQLAQDHEPPTLARKPTFGTNDEMPQIKPGYFPIFEGESEDTLVFLNWIDVIFAFLEGRTPRVHLDMMTRHAKGRALSVIVQWRNEQRDNVTEVVRFLESELGGIVSPEIAINYLNQLTLLPGESIGSVASVIHQYALMAHARDSPERRESNINDTERRYILRLLPPKLLKQYNDFAHNAKISGKPEMSSREMIKHLIRFNQQNIDAEENHRIAMRMAKVGPGHEVNHIAAGRRPRMTRHGTHRPAIVPHRRGRVRTVVEDPYVDNVFDDPPDDGDHPEFAVDNASDKSNSGDEDDDQGIFEIREQVRFSPAYFGVRPGECFKCGQKNHRYRGDSAQACPLKNHELEMKRCPLCRKGGHKRENCVNRKN